MDRRLVQILRSSAFQFLFSCLILFSSVAFLFSWIYFSPFPRAPLPSPSSSAALGCRPDGEGSWSIGVFYGDSPFTLAPIERQTPDKAWRNESAAWPVANPVVTCASASNAGYPSNFVADPFLYIQGDTFYLFFETKNSITLKGEIGVAVSKDKGATWQHLGIVLDEKWHLSYPYVFSYQDQIYMMPEGNKKGELRLYHATDFPLKWKLEKVLLKKPLIDSFIIDYQGYYWLFGSDFSAFGAKKNGELEIWYSSSPLGPWKSHKMNPVHNADKSLGARNAGRPFMYNGHLYRTGQDCGETYGRRIRAFKVTVLTTDKYEEVEVPLGIEEPKKGRNAWNGARYHHLDAQQLPSGEWIGVVDGDRVPSGDSVRRLVLGYVAFAAAVTLALLFGVLMSAIKCIVPPSLYLPISGKRSDDIQRQEHRHHFYSKLTWVLAHMNKLASSLQGRVKPNTCIGRLVVIVTVLIGVALTCIGTHYVYGGNGAEEPYPVKGHYSQFTLLTMTYDARLWNLKMYVKHYSRCSSVREIVVVWNKGQPPSENDFDSAVPVRIRIEDKNSLNNRFKPDPLIKTRAVLELDDDIMMTCDDVERGFKVWRDHPDRIVGFYPRLASGSPLMYRDEKYSRSHQGYNMVLTGAAFVDKGLAFGRYWSEEAAEGRKIVDGLFNCEDVLLNFLYANASSSSKAVEYVKPSWAIDTSKFTGAAISKNTQVHYQKRSECIQKFTKLYGNLAGNRWGFNSRKDGWDV
ncbi:glycosyltransferase family protein 64 protein C5 [Iris pallida]|uniref:Glucosamine inositolphosphorylceramide transferase 1 n=1 Tax=Iris pallida TaxID=29817 RepID=A0AAX6H4J0_IRIPA|nr:glycosyltransferase family protein 64 protein C5 [Iris pallida]